MIDPEMFLGWPVPCTLLYQMKELKQEYLVLLERDGQVYMGKKIGKAVDREALQNLEANIYSLLHKLHPEYPFKNTSLVLFPYAGI